MSDESVTTYDMTHPWRATRTARAKLAVRVRAEDKLHIRGPTREDLDLISRPHKVAPFRALAVVALLVGVSNEHSQTISVSAEQYAGRRHARSGAAALGPKVRPGVVVVETQGQRGLQTEVAPGHVQRGHLLRVAGSVPGIGGVARIDIDHGAVHEECAL